MRLQQIASLRSLGFSLAEIRGLLEDSNFSPLRVIEFHVAQLSERIELERKLCSRLEAVAARLDSTQGSVGDISTEEFVEIVMEVTKMSEKIEKYYTPEQREQLERHRQELGEERTSAVEAEWPVLIEQVRVEMETGTDPADERVQRLARRWMELVEEFTGGDSGILSSVKNMWQQEESLMGIETASMREKIHYISQANAAANQRD
jgi:DNA-binding transcriptional MerR regulator